MLRDSLPSNALQVSDIVHRIRGGGLAKLGGNTRRTPSSASSRKVRAPPTLSDAPRYLKKSDAPRLTLTLQLCHRATLTFSPRPPSSPRRQFRARVQGDVRAEFRYPTQPSCAARRFPARAPRRARVPRPSLFSWLWHAGITREVACAAHPSAEGSPARAREVRRLTRHSPAFRTHRIHRPREQRLRTHGFPGALCPSSLPFAHPPPRSLPILPSIVLFHRYSSPANAPPRARVDLPETCARSDIFPPRFYEAVRVAEAQVPVRVRGLRLRARLS